MLIFTLVISFLTTSNLPWLMFLTFQVHRQVLFFIASDFTSIISHIHNWALFLLWLHLFFLELFLYSSPVAYWVPTELGSSSFSVISFCLFILFMGFLREEYWSGLPFPSPVDHVLSELSTVTLLSWVALHGMVLSFTGLDKAVIHVISLVSFLCFSFSFCLPSDGLEACGSFLMQQSDCGGNWVFFWWARPCSV